MSAESYLTISEVVAHLNPDYPDLRESKLRYLEQEGLISPARTPGGYRKYTNENVERIRTILRLQDENFLPLSVIKERMDAHDDTSQILETDNLHDEFHASSQTRVLLSQAHIELGVTESFVHELAKTGLVTIRSGKTGDYIDGNDAEISIEVWKLRPFGVEPRHLKMYAYFSHKEADFFELILAPAYRIRTEVSTRRLDEALREIGKITTSLKSRLSQKALYNRMKGLL
jgi:DNA-binding transcriptional MerR regulator